MTFVRTEPSFHYRALRLISKNGQWEMGLSPYYHGVRLRVGRTRRPPTFLDVCLGHESRSFLPALESVMQMLAPLEESATHQEIEEALSCIKRPPSPARPDSLSDSANSTHKRVS